MTDKLSQKSAYIAPREQVLSVTCLSLIHIFGDGEIQEGQVWEAAMLAAHRKLDNLVVIVDNNNLQIDGAIDEVNSCLLYTSRCV